MNRWAVLPLPPLLPRLSRFSVCNFCKSRRAFVGVSPIRRKLLYLIRNDSAWAIIRSAVAKSLRFMAARACLSRSATSDFCWLSLLLLENCPTEAVPTESHVAPPGAADAGLTTSRLAAKNALLMISLVVTFKTILLIGPHKPTTHLPGRKVFQVDCDVVTLWISQ